MNKTKLKSEINKMKTQWKIVCFTAAKPPSPLFDAGLTPSAAATSTDDKFKSLYLSVTAVEIKHVA